MSNNLENYLTNDQSVPGQNYVCLSFLSPDKILKDKHMYFLLHYVMDKIGYDKGYDKFEEEYGDWMFSRRTNLEKEFYEKNNFKTTVRGIKVRGVYDTQSEAKARAAQLRRMDGTHDIYVGQVGFWLPWDPEPFDVQDQEYLEKDLNTLMKSKKENEIKKNLHFEEEKRKKMEYNMKKGKGFVNDFENELYKDDPWSRKNQSSTSATSTVSTETSSVSTSETTSSVSTSVTSSVSTSASSSTSSATSASSSAPAQVPELPTSILENEDVLDSAINDLENN